MIVENQLGKWQLSMSPRRLSPPLFWPERPPTLAVDVSGRVSMASSDAHEPLLEDKARKYDEEAPPRSDRRALSGVSINTKESVTPVAAPVPRGGCAARMRAYKASLFVMVTMTGVSIVYGGFSAVVAVFLHKSLELPERWATFAVNIFGCVLFCRFLLLYCLSSRHCHLCML